MKENKNQKVLPLLEKGEAPDKSCRRTFLKKAIYTAPALVTLGQLVNPSQAHADGSHGPSGPPRNGWNPRN